jgi:hypothetical protein
MTFLYLLGPMLVLTWRRQPVTAGWLGAGAWALVMVAYALILRAYGRGCWQGLALPLVALLYTLMTIHSASRHTRGHGGYWKGRTYPAPDSPRPIV